VGNETLRSMLAAAAASHLPDWPERVTPHVLRHLCASQLYLGGMDLVAIQATLGHAWIATTMNYIHVQSTHIEDSWVTGQSRAADRLKGLAP
jgi:integrase/recombinase XerD